MAGTMLNVTRAPNHYLVELVGSFFPQGTLAPLPNPAIGSNTTSTVPQFGLGIASITRTAVGVYLVTLLQSWFRLLSANVEVRVADGAAAPNTNTAGFQNMNVTNAVVNGNPARTLNVNLSTVTTAPALADIAAATGAAVYFTLWLQNTSVQ